MVLVLVLVLVLVVLLVLVLVVRYGFVGVNVADTFCLHTTFTLTRILFHTI